MTSRWHSTDPAGDGYEGAEPPRCDDCGEVNDVEPCACYRDAERRLRDVIATGRTIRVFPEPPSGAMRLARSYRNGSVWRLVGRGWGELAGRWVAAERGEFDGKECWRGVRVFAGLASNDIVFALSLPSLIEETQTYASEGAAYRCAGRL